LWNLFLRFGGKFAKINSAINNSVRIYSALINSLKVILFCATPEHCIYLPSTAHARSISMSGPTEALCGI